MHKDTQRPPWIVYPEVLPGDSFWRYGQNPICRLFFYWDSLDQEEHQNIHNRPILYPLMHTTVNSR